MTRIVNNPNRSDLHPDDLIMRQKLREAFMQMCRERGQTRQTISIAAGERPRALDRSLSTYQWRYPTLQHTARILDHYVQPYWEDPATGVEVYPAENEAMRAMCATKTADRIDEIARYELREAALTLRQQLGVGRKEMAIRLKTTAAKLDIQESGDMDHFLTVSIQRYFRALGCPLRFHLICEATGDRYPLPDPEKPVQRATAPSPRPAIETPQPSARLRVIDSGANVMLVVTGDDHKLTGLHIPADTWRAFLAEQALTHKP